MNYIFAILDFAVISFLSFSFFSIYAKSLTQIICIILFILAVTFITLFLKNNYESAVLAPKKYYTLFESLMVSTGIICFIIFMLSGNPLLYTSTIIVGILGYIIMSLTRLILTFLKKVVQRPKNVLIVGAGQDGKLIAEEIKQRPELKLNVVGFLDDNMNTIEDQDSSIKILGLTCDSEAVIKDNNVKLVIIAVKSRMDSDILTDLVKGIPLGVKVWRMYRFYERITHKFLVSKMSVNWLFYDCVRKKALIYAYLKRFCDVIASVALLILTFPFALVAAIGIKLSDLGPVFYTQMRAGKFGKPFKMIKFRTMYHDKLDDDFDDDRTEVSSDDLRIIPFCKILRKFHIDEIPQLLNVLRGDMSIVGPRPIMEEVYDENKQNIPFWECRNWVRPGWCGWQQVNVNEPTAEQRMGYDLYYIKHQNLVWDIYIFLRYICKVVLGKARGK